MKINIVLPHWTVGIYRDVAQITIFDGQGNTAVTLEVTADQFMAGLAGWHNEKIKACQMVIPEGLAAAHPDYQVITRQAEEPATEDQKKYWPGKVEILRSNDGDKAWFYAILVDIDSSYALLRPVMEVSDYRLTLDVNKIILPYTITRDDINRVIHVQVEIAHAVDENIIPHGKANG